MNEGFIDFSKEIMAALKEGPKLIQRFVIAGAILLAIGGLLAITGDLYPDYRQITEPLAFAFAGTGGVFLFGVYIYRKSLEEVAKEQKYEEVEQRVKDNPLETQAAWELARVKLESYLDRNLKQVRSIFWLTVFVMLAGFSLIAFGVYTVIDSPDKIAAAVIASASGILVNFIGATFLILYKSTMSQATEYVAILERINAVGMSVQILETIVDDEDKLKQKTTAEVAKQLLSLYTTQKVKA
jgi:hypothetical protein